MLTTQFDHQSPPYPKPPISGRRFTINQVCIYIRILGYGLSLICLWVRSDGQIGPIEVEMQKLICGFLLVILSGCASQIMQRYIGQDAREVVVDYGPPANAMDMGDGRRAFQWVMDSSYTTPTTTSRAAAPDTAARRQLLTGRFPRSGR